MVAFERTHYAIYSIIEVYEQDFGAPQGGGEEGEGDEEEGGPEGPLDAQQPDHHHLDELNLMFIEIASSSHKQADSMIKSYLERHYGSRHMVENV